MGRSVSEDSESPVRGRRSPHRRSPTRSSPSRGERSPVHHRSSYRGRSPEREKHSGRGKSPKRVSPQSRSSRSPSPRTKRLRRAQAERETEKVKEREHERSNGKGSEKSTRREKEREREKDREREREREKGREREKEKEKGKDRERGSNNEIGNERKERRSERDEKRSGRDNSDNRSSRGRRDRSTSPSDRHQRNKHRSNSPTAAAGTRAHDEGTKSRGDEGRNDENDSLCKMKATEEALEAKQKDKPSFELSGKLAAETNRVRGVTLLFSEPPDARKPDVRWRLYVFKAGEVLNEPLYIHRQSCYLFGRERRVADVPTDHPSCSKQHAVIQFRQVEKEQPDGTLSKQPRIRVTARELCCLGVINKQGYEIFRELRQGRRFCLSIMLVLEPGRHFCSIHVAYLFHMRWYTALVFKAILFISFGDSPTYYMRSIYFFQ
ncbi:FHA domain-containing protein DDL isoform X2 [Carica papaya]|uniref:FHA domain-containing protein DDL isoform X2 n=1 Tax=Carica papaya TaxID=3649 RepID=UPI000B8CB355|nr:FHA domain-containing protein DDL isoform X2 [Carica papaya]